MNYPAASIGVSSSLLARHSVLDTESSRAFWIPAGVYPGENRGRYDQLTASGGNGPSWIQPPGQTPSHQAPLYVGRGFHFYLRRN